MLTGNSDGNMAGLVGGEIWRLYDEKAFLGVRQKARG